jgi:hypothetical protein
MPNEYIPEQAVEITRVTGTVILTGVKVSPGAVKPGTAWTEFTTPTRERMALSSGAMAVHE